jgi:site-specific DNA-cytosine methylase
LIEAEFPEARVDGDCVSGAREHWWRNVAEIVTFGFPCQAFSQAKIAGPGQDPDRAIALAVDTLWPLADGKGSLMVLEKLPLLVVLENVVGLATHHPGALARLEFFLEMLPYVRRREILSPAHHVGDAVLRHRLYWVLARQDAARGETGRFMGEAASSA